MIDQVWGKSQPLLPTTPVRVHPIVYAGDSTIVLVSFLCLIFCSVFVSSLFEGRTVSEKIALIRQNLRSNCTFDDQQQVCTLPLLIQRALFV